MPEPRPFHWLPRKLEDAHTSLTQLKDGRLEMEVRHAPLKNVTSEMLHWWLGVYPMLKVTHSGTIYDAYMIWHPRDHVAVKTVKNDGTLPLKVGDKFMVEEAYGRSLRYRHAEEFTVTWYDSSEFMLVVRRGGMKAADLQYRYADGPGGAEVVTRLRIGGDKGLSRLIVNNLIVTFLFDAQKIEAWMQHSVEEVGFWDEFLPALYQERSQGKTIVGAL